MKRKLDTIRALSRAEVCTLAAAWLLLLVADFGLRLVPLADVRRWLASAAALVPRRPALAPERLHRLVGAASRHHLYPMHCLQRSLCLEALLGRRAAMLRIGIRRQARRELAAHAWVELAGRPVGEPAAVRGGFLSLEGGG